MRNKVLVVGAHTDDEVMGCGATICKHIRNDDFVFCLAMSDCGEVQLPEEMGKAMDVLGCNAHDIMPFTVRKFHQDTHEIRHILYQLRGDYNIIYTHASSDWHPDHQVVHKEVKAAFKNDKSIILGFDTPGNNPTFNCLCYNILSEADVDAKLMAAQQYRSQSNRLGADMGYLRSIMRIRGQEVNAEYAEGFEVIRMVNING